ncbi:hypothetical protein DB346_06125 [Verrucomicrobia bacterium LW23]|nr:hypothetical protein DB346_06125 [Verrucomicrobia bacterium LW23]
MSLTEKAFLDLLAKDIDENPHTLVPVTVEMVERRMALVEGVDVDLDGPLEGED